MAEELESQSLTTEKLLASGTVERLVQEGRTPLRIGNIGPGDREMMPFYQVPPKGFNSEEVNRVFTSFAGCLVFELKDGRHLIGETFCLTEEQAAEVELRIAKSVWSE